MFRELLVELRRMAYRQSRENPSSPQGLRKAAFAPPMGQGAGEKILGARYYPLSVLDAQRGLWQSTGDYVEDANDIMGNRSLTRKLR